MRVRGNVSPGAVSIEAYGPMPGFVEVRLRENVKEISVADEMTNTEVTMYEYDEYVFRVKDRERLQKDIEENLSDWIMSGKAIESKEGSSALAELAAQNDALVNDMAQLVEEVYRSDLELMTE